MKLQATQNFTLKDFDKLINIVRKDLDVKGKLYEGDIFECDEEMAKYLLGDNKYKQPFVEVIEEKDITEFEFEVRSEEVKNLVDKKC